MNAGQIASTIAVRSLTHTAINKAAYGGSFGKNLKTAALSEVGSAAGKSLASKIGGLKVDGTIDTVSHKLLHGTTGTGDYLWR